MTTKTLTLESLNDALVTSVVVLTGAWVVVVVALGNAWDRIKRHEELHRQEHKP